MIRGSLIVAALPLLVTGCASKSWPPGEPGGSHAGDPHVSRSELGDAWPLTVESGELGCTQTVYGPALSITVDGTTYWLALGAPDQGWKPINRIRRADPVNAMLRADTQPLVDRAMELCH